MFPPEYHKHNIPVIINNEKIALPILAEEYATMFSKYFDTKYMDMTSFKKNFWKELKPELKDLNVDNLDDIDITPIKKYLEYEKEKKKLLSKEDKEKEKVKIDALEEPYKFCIIDGVQQQVGNYKIEPPGIFIGRGNHPKIGHIKKRIKPEDVIINISKDAPIPKPPSGKWKDVINDKSVIWLSSWKEEITGKNKYVFTSLDSFFKSKSDESKFDLARSLKKKAANIRETYEKQLNNSDDKIKQLATALYFIDHLALRVGGNKDTKEEADTVGVTSLRVEHISLLDNNIIKLDFLGKDSVRYCKKVSVHSQVYDNIQYFVKNKKNKDDIFDLITSSTLNDYLSSFLKGLTAKVWRTYNASLVFQKELDKIKLDKIENADPNEKLNYLIAMFNQANTEVALLCNHQKNVNTNLDNMLDKIDNQIKELKKKKNNTNDKYKIRKIDGKLKVLKVKKETKVKMKNVSLGTSKNNYIDPRIIFAFIKKYDIPPEKLFTKVLLKRFEWASKVDKDYNF
jgi:DNA topoisomerase-1